MQWKNLQLISEKQSQQQASDRHCVYFISKFYSGILIIETVFAKLGCKHKTPFKPFS